MGKLYSPYPKGEFSFGISKIGIGNIDVPINDLIGQVNRTFVLVEVSSFNGEMKLVFRPVGLVESLEESDG